MLERAWESGQLRWLGAPIAPFYGAAIFLKDCAYHLKLCKSTRVSVPVISVGNITVGGSGKTPLVLALLDLLEEKRVGVLSRGYRREGKGLMRVDETSTPAQVGDEPYLIWQRKKPIVIVGADRVVGAQMAIDAGAEILVLDDGFQHRRLARDLDIVIDDGAKEHLFPWGRLREPRSSLGRADWVEKPCIEAEPLDISGKRVALFCGIARPERFVATVKQMGAEIVETLFLRDHEAPSLDALQRLSGDLILCTEKDWVKLPPTDLPIECVRIRHRPSENLIDHIRCFI